MQPNVGTLEWIRLICTYRRLGCSAGSWPKNPNSAVPRLGQANGLEDCISDLIWRKGVDGDRKMGSPIERQAALVTAGKVGLVSEDGSNALSATAAGEGGGKLDFEMDENGAGGGEQQRACGWVLDGATAQSENQVVAAGQVCDGGVFAITEGGFAMAGEEFGDGSASFRLDDVVDVGEGPAEVSGDQRADRAFA